MAQMLANIFNRFFRLKLCQPFANTRRLVILLALISFEVVGQEARRDSLKQLLQSTTGMERFKVLRQLSLISEDDYETYLHYINETIQVMTITADSFEYVRTYHNKGHALVHLNRTYEILDFFPALYEVAKRHNHYILCARISNLLGQAYLHRAEYTQAIRSFGESLEYRKQLNGFNMEVI